jgi:tetratricopeptide (TPR) repeat protein
MSKTPQSRRTGQSGKVQAGSKLAPKREVRRVDAYLSGAILVLACFILFLPLVVNYSFYYPYIFLKSILFRVAVEVMVLIYVILAVRFPAYRPRINLLTGALVAFFGAMLVSSLPGVSFSSWNSWWGDFARMGGMFTQLHLLAYFFILVQIFKGERDWLVLFTASLFFGVLMGLSGLIQSLGLDFLYRLKAGERIQGAAGNTIWFATHMLLNFFIVLWFLGRKDKRAIYASLAKYWIILLGSFDSFLLIWEMWSSGGGSGIVSAGVSSLPIAIFLAALHLLSLCWFFMRGKTAAGMIFLCLLGGYYLYWIFQSQTRAAIVGLFGSLLFLLIVYALSGMSRKLRWIALSLILILLMLSSIILLNRQSAWVKDRPALHRLTLFSVQDVMAARYWAWKASALAILDRPILGYGLENYNIGFDRHFPPQVSNPSDEQLWFDRAHNIILDVGVTSGFLGLTLYSLFYILVFTFLVRQWFRTKDPTDSLLILSLLLAYLFQGLATFDTVNTDVVVFLLLAYVAWLSRRESMPQPSAPNQPVSGTLKSQWGVLCIAGVIGVLIPASWLLIWKPVESNLLLNQAIGFSKAYDPRTRSTGLVYGEGILDLFQRASDCQTTGRYQVREESANYTSELIRVSEVPQVEKTAAAKRAISLLQESIRQEPLNARRYMYLASLVNRCYGVLLQSDPAWARSLVEKNLDLLQKAESLSPTRPQIFLERAQTLSYLGRVEEQVVALERGVALSPPIKELHLDLMAAYIIAGRYDEATKEWQLVKSLPGLVPLTQADYERIIGVYYSKKQFEPMVRLYKEVLKIVPDQPQLLARLATTYRDMGEIELARQTALKAASLSAQIGAALQDFLSSLERRPK